MYITYELNKRSEINICKLSIKHILHFFSGSFSIQCRNWTLSSRTKHNIGYSSQASDLQFTGSLSTIPTTPYEVKPNATMQNFMDNVTNRETGNPGRLPNIGGFLCRTLNIDFLYSVI